MRFHRFASLFARSKRYEALISAVQSFDFSWVTEMDDGSIEAMMRSGRSRDHSTALNGIGSERRAG
jgi:hypothetical protein